MIELTAAQILIIGFVASFITKVLQVILTRWPKYYPGLFVMNIFLFVISVILGLLWFHPVLPVAGADIPAFATAILNTALVIVGAAGLIYNWLLKSIVFPAVRLVAAEKPAPSA